MVFNSLTFVLFFAAVLLLHHTLSNWTAKKVVLLAASYLFYAAWNPPFVVLLMLSTLVDWLAARQMAKARTAVGRKAWLVVSLGANLGLLGFFKYGPFLLQNFSLLVRSAGFEYVPPESNIILPLGISFYTFETLSYTIDVYRRQLEPNCSLLDFGLFVGFFPHLVAGPIVRASDFLPQLESERRVSSNQLGWGLFLMTLGLFQKNVVADTLLSDAADAVFGAPGPASQLDTWVGAIAFAGQIFSDFAGYTTCAIGAALCLGFSLVDNFHAPYAAIGFRDFWRRWHISLSSWLRDYLYIPLGGNRAGRTRTAVALFLTMLLGGLWHGAAWHFVVWGALHGLFLVVEHALTCRFGTQVWVQWRTTRVALAALTFALTCIAWVFFRAPDVPRAMMHVAAMLGAIPVEPVLKTTTLVKVLVTTTLLLGAHVALRRRSLEHIAVQTPWPVLVSVWTVMLSLTAFSQGGGNAFIYFQF